MQQIKGSVLKSRLSFVDEHAGKEGVQRVIELLPDEDRKALRLLLAVSWYPFELGKRLDAAIVKIVGGGRPDFFWKLGEASAQQNLTSLHKNFLSPGRPHDFLAKAPQIYRLYYETGRREYAQTGPTSGVLTTFDAETFSAPDCQTVMGWYQRALELNGATEVKVTEKECRAQGGEVCRYELKWS